MAAKENTHQVDESKTPIVDIHVHVFNALDIPIEGYLRSRWSERMTRSIEYYARFFLPQMFGYLTDRMRERCHLREFVNQYYELEEFLESDDEKESLKEDVGLSKEEAKLLENEESPRRGPIYGILLWVFSKAMGQRLGDWEEVLTKDVGRVAEELLAVEWVRPVDLYIPLMVDYEYWFRNTFDNDLKTQINNIYEKVVIPNQGRIHPFVPFDPARELVWENREKMLTPDGQRPQYGSLDLVEDAIENKGFIGVKVYNSLGYKPLGNDDELTTLRRKRIAVRNEKMQYLFPRKDYDRVLRKLYKYCAENQVPITTHCQTGGIEAYPEASFHFGDPIFWCKVLDEYPDLHLNLGHFGWSHEQGYSKDEGGNWIKKICDMMVKYDHLYADISHHGVISSRSRGKYISSYEAMRNDYADTGLEKLKRRILYGSDWHVLKRARSFEIFMEKYIQVVEQASFYTKEEMEDFLGGNALEFLGLLPGGKNRERLEDFYTKKKIPPPYWFTSTASKKPSA